ncbi:HEPN domain-containing protein [Candidatus Woesearchaeota archaeon]|nr:HEPN domain-containing protein [Candidatus Woesearchaeota archaeon]
MKLFDFNKMIDDPKLLENKIRTYQRKNILVMQPEDKALIKGHQAKAEHNLRFIKDNLKLGYHDWCVVGCYYAAYQAAMALLSKKGYRTKSHDATLCVLIKEYHNQGIDAEDIALINSLFFDYHDLLFYVQSKLKREEATYSTRYVFDKSLVEQLRIKSIMFVNKAKQILESQN